MDQNDQNFVIVDFDDLSPVACPCGQARRAFLDVPDFPATIHRTEITADAKTHYHRRLTEVYYVLQSAPQAALEWTGGAWRSTPACACSSALACVIGPRADDGLDCCGTEVRSGGRGDCRVERVAPLGKRLNGDIRAVHRRPGKSPAP